MSDAWSADAPPCPASPPPYRFLRFDESYAYLQRPECRTEAWDALKEREIGAARFTIGGDIRIRDEFGRNIRFQTSTPNPDNDIVQRYHLHAQLRLDPGLRLFGELKSNHVSGRDPGPIGTDVDRLDIHQAFVEMVEPERGRARMGRQEMAFGAFRRIFPRNGPNVRGSFDAIRVTTRPVGWTLDAFAFKPVAIVAGPFDDASINEQRYWGAYATAPAGFAAGSADFYYIGLARDSARFAQGVADELRHTIGARFFGRDGAWDHDIEPTLQWGHFGGGALRAWAIEGESGFTFREAAYRPRVSLRYSAASGDGDPARASLETFNPMLPRGGALGEVWNFSAANLLHLRLALDLQLSAGLAAQVSADGTWRKSLRDGVYGSGGNILVPAGTSRARAVGTDVDATVNWRATRQLLLSVSAGYFRNGAFSRDAGLKHQWLVFPFLAFQF